MAAPTTFPGDVHISGSLTVGSFTPSSGSVTNASIAAAAAIQATKLEHQYERTYAQAGNATDESRILHNAYGAGDIIAVRVSCLSVPIGDSTCTVDVKLNGTTILSGVITLNSSSVLYTQQAGTLVTTTYTAGQVFSTTIDATAGTGTLPTGVSVTLVLREDAAP